MGKPNVIRSGAISTTVYIRSTPGRVIIEVKDGVCMAKINANIMQADALVSEIIEEIENARRQQKLTDLARSNR